jgi:hypothetical protein
MIPSQKAGMLTPKSATSVVQRSKADRGRVAERIPISIPASVE